MKNIIRGIMSATLLAAGLALVGATAAEAQLNIEGRGGVAIPVGDLAELTEVGGGFGLGLGYQLHPRINLRLDGDVDLLTGADDLALFPDLTVWRYNGGVELGLTPPDSRFTLSTNVGAGASTIDSDDFAVEDVSEPLDFTHTYFAANGGVRAGYDVTENVNIFVGGQAYVTFADAEELRLLTAFSTELANEDVDDIWSIPVFAGLRITLPGGDRQLAAVSAPR